MIDENLQIFFSIFYDDFGIKSGDFCGIGLNMVKCGKQLLRVLNFGG